jgi:hypothetical protein
MRGSHDVMGRVGTYVVRLLATMARLIWAGALVVIDAPAELGVAMQLLWQHDPAPSKQQSRAVPAAQDVPAAQWQHARHGSAG